MSAPQDFAARFAATGLPLEEYDLEALADAVARLEVLFGRLDEGDPDGAVPLFRFDPTERF